MSRQCCYVVLLLAVHYFSGCFAQQNITVHGTDPAIVYSSSGSDASGTLPFSTSGVSKFSNDDPNSSATFGFTGVAVYFLSYMLPYSMSIQVQLDNGSPVLLNLTGPEPTYFGAEVIWSSGPIPNIPHTLTLTSNSLIQSLAFGITYTALDPLPLTSTTPTSLPTSSSSSLSSSSSSSATDSSGLPTSTTQGVALPTSISSNNSSSSSHHPIPIILGITFGVLSLLFFIGFFAWLYLRRRRRPRPESWTITGAQPSLSSYHDYHHGGPSDTSDNFNPWPGLSYTTHQQQQALYTQQQIPDGQQERHSPFHATITLSMITDKSTPVTMNSNQLSLGSPPASHTPIELRYGGPPLGMSASGDQSPCVSDLPVGAAAPAGRHQNSPASPTSLRGLTAAGVRNVRPRNMKSSPLAVVNRTNDEQENLGPPAYSL